MFAFCTGPAALPRSGLSYASTSVCVRAPPAVSPMTLAPGEIQAAKHVQKKATKKAMDRRPKKKRPSDKYRKPPPYDVDPLHAEG